METKPPFHNHICYNSEKFLANGDYKHSLGRITKHSVVYCCPTATIIQPRLCQNHRWKFNMRLSKIKIKLKSSFSNGIINLRHDIRYMMRWCQGQVVCASEKKLQLWFKCKVQGHVPNKMGVIKLRFCNAVCRRYMSKVLKGRWM